MFNINHSITRLVNAHMLMNSCNKTITHLQYRITVTFYDIFMCKGTQIYTFTSNININNFVL